MVYSTCTYNVEENELIASWALKTFPCLQVVDPGIQIGRPGYSVGGMHIILCPLVAYTLLLFCIGLTADQCQSMRRFGTLDVDETDDARWDNSDYDTIGFFLCCFQKNCE